MAKLTLSVDDGVVSRAKQYAKLQGVSVSEMVESYLAAVAKPTSPSQPDAPVLRSIRGILKHADVDNYRKYLAHKYR
jgi:antitoxin component of RelBE/YafQ-DinJ toxin-antitoxin module